MKLSYLVFWSAVIFSISCSFAQLTDVSSTPTQGAFQAGGFQTTPVTTSPSQQAFEIGSTPPSSGPHAPSQRANQSEKNQILSGIQTGGLPSVKISSPTEGAIIPAGNVTVTDDVRNFKLVNKLGQMDVAGEGHLHYYIDVQVPKTPGKPAVTAIGTFAPTINITWTWPNVKPGKHNLSVQLANNDHTPVIPLVYKTVNITVSDSTLKTMSLEGVTIDLVAKNMSFNTTKITVPAGANITVNFDNQDQYIPHNLAVYTDASAKTAIYQGKPVTGPAKVSYTFTAPIKAGTYFFRCDVHPMIMTGQFIVQ